MLALVSVRLGLTVAACAAAALLTACDPGRMPLPAADAATAPAAQVPTPPPSAPSSPAPTPPTFPPASGPASGPASNPTR
jgi:hypothetical protein